MVYQCDILEGVRMVYPDLYNYDLARLSRAGEGEEALVSGLGRAMTGLLTRLGWVSTRGAPKNSSSLVRT